MDWYYWEVFDSNSESIFTENLFYVETSRQAVKEYCKQKWIENKFKRSRMWSLICTYMKKENWIVYRTNKKKNVYYMWQE